MPEEDDEETGEFAPIITWSHSRLPSESAMMDLQFVQGQGLLNSYIGNRLTIRFIYVQWRNMSVTRVSKDGP